MRVNSIRIVRSAPNDRTIDWAPKRIRSRGVWWHYVNLPFGRVLVIRCREAA